MRLFKIIAAFIFIFTSSFLLISCGNNVEPEETQIKNKITTDNTLIVATIREETHYWNTSPRRAFFEIKVENNFENPILVELKMNIYQNNVFLETNTITFPISSYDIINAPVSDIVAPNSWTSYVCVAYVKTIKHYQGGEAQQGKSVLVSGFATESYDIDTNLITQPITVHNNLYYDIYVDIWICFYPNGIYSFEMKTVKITKRNKTTLNFVFERDDYNPEKDFLYRTNFVGVL